MDANHPATAASPQALESGNISSMVLQYLFPIEATSKLHGRPSALMYYWAKAVLNLTATYFGVPEMFFLYVELYGLMIM